MEQAMEVEIVKERQEGLRVNNFKQKIKTLRYTIYKGMQMFENMEVKKTSLE